MNENRSVLMITAIVNKDNMSELQDYLNNVLQVFSKNGGKPVARYKTAESLLGEDAPEMAAFIEFPNADTIKNMISGDEFKALSDARARVFSKLNMLICESF